MLEVSPSHNQHRLLIAGLAQNDVGLTNVLNAITQELKCFWNIKVFAHGLEDKIYTPVEGVETELSMLQDWDVSTQIHFSKVIEAFKPEVILIIGHPWKAPKFKAVAAKYADAKLAVYMPIEGRPVGKTIADSLTGVNLCITYTAFAKDALADLMGNKKIKTINIGHGYEGYFKPISSDNSLAKTEFRKTLRKQLFPNHAEFWNRPMLLNSNRCYYRKRLDLTIKGFALALREVDASLYLNVAALSNYEQHKLEHLIKTLGIENNVMLNTLHANEIAITKLQLLQLYNASDIGITTSMGEGWGLCVFEHAATGAAQIVPDHSSFSENWQNLSAIKFKADKAVYLQDEAAEMYEGEPQDIARAVTKLVKNPMLLGVYSDNALEHVNSSNFKWSTIGAKFNTALKGLVKDTVVLS